MLCEVTRSDLGNLKRTRKESGIGLKPWPCTPLASTLIHTPIHFVPSLHIRVSGFTFSQFESRHGFLTEGHPEALSIVQLNVAMRQQLFIPPQCFPKDCDKCRGPKQLDHTAALTGLEVQTQLLAVSFLYTKRVDFSGRGQCANNTGRTFSSSLKEDFLGEVEDEA
ncbi:hypothetical protein STEG23_003492 [Scotinomys teguina]